ncbi:MAG TPA: LacI family DNA-binding transcriptional regulator [Steroidobacteraceae bacterium]|jgi:LacI family gluconate utilization system Gnt-I transcriptional repressor|nr:LacI family DNA-binding transcriptional regulator [Steroidobacteraceae bacterium]
MRRRHVRKSAHSAAARAPTLEDVARVAGVSTATISRTLNNAEQVTAHTRERVRLAIAKTGYVPNLLAGGLASKRSRLVAALVPSIATSLFNETIESMSLALSAAGYQVVLGLTGYEPEGMSRAVISLLSHRPDALILTGAPTDPLVRRHLRAARVTVIETWDLPRTPVDLAIGFSHRQAGRALADFVVKQGYRRPLIMTHDLARGRARMEGFLERWREQHLPEPICDIAAVTPFAIDGRARLRAFLKSGGRADVVLCSSDRLAWAVLSEATARGLKVPQNLAVIGFGASDSSALAVPALTSVRIDGAQIGRRAAEALILRTRGLEPPARRIDIGFEILARDTA